MGRRPPIFDHLPSPHLSRVASALRDALRGAWLFGRRVEPSAALQGQPDKKIRFEALEQRLLLSGDVLPAASSLLQENEPDNNQLLTATMLPLSEDPVGSGLAIGRGQGRQEPASYGDGCAAVVRYQFELPSTANIAITGDAPAGGIGALLGSDADGDASARDTRHPLVIPLNSAEELLATDAYYIQITNRGVGASPVNDTLESGAINLESAAAYSSPCAGVAEGRGATSESVTGRDAGDAPSRAPGGQRQVIYLDFDGGRNVEYRGPIDLSIDVEPFIAAGSFAGSERDVIDATLAAVNLFSQPLSVTFTIDQPISGEFSTIHVGGDGAAFAQWGHYLGVAEKVDVGNRDRSDRGFVFTENIAAVARSVGEYGRILAAYIGHEAGHLLGWEHERAFGGPDDPLAAVAWKPYTHVEIGRDVLADVVADGQVTILGRNYTVHPAIVDALRACPEDYYAGTVGPDGFPDLIMGQGVIHPQSTGAWLMRILDMAWKAQSDPSFSAGEKQKILAFSYGFLTHAASDHWGHTLVNEFAEGTFPDIGDIAANALAGDTRDLANSLRHILVENYVASATAGFDNDSDRGPAPGGDISDDSTPGIPYDVPVRFLYETLLRPFPMDPTLLADSGEQALTVDAQSNQFRRTGSGGAKLSDSFRVGQRVTAAGFVANNETYTVRAVSEDALTVEEDLISGDELTSPGARIVVHVPYTEAMRFDVDAASDSFVSVAGGFSFRERGFVPGMRFAASGFVASDGEYVVRSVSDDRLVVEQDLVADESGSGDEQFAVQGSRGKVFDLFISLRARLEDEVRNKPRADFGQLVANAIDSVARGESLSGEALEQLKNAYLYNWIDNLSAGMARWGEFGLAITKALFDPQSRRDLQNEEGEPYGEEADLVREDRENRVGLLDVIVKELDDPNGDGWTTDSFINNRLLPMLGVPRELAFVRTALQAVGHTLNEAIVEPLQLTFNPLLNAAADIKAAIGNFIKAQIEDKFGFSFEVFEQLANLGAKMDLQSLTIDGHEMPIFKPGDREKLNALMGVPAGSNRELPAGYDALPGFVFYPDARGALVDGARLDKAQFAAYANSVVVSQLLFLSEDPVDGELSSQGQLSRLMSDVLGAPYDWGKLNDNGEHGGNILSSSLPGLTDEAPWLSSIDDDHGWRSDSLTTTALMYRTSDDADAKASWMGSVSPGAMIGIQVSWLDNTSAGVEPTEHARYRIFDDAVAVGSVSVNQRRQSNDLAAGGISYEEIGNYTFHSGTVRVELDRAGGPDTASIIAGPVRLVPLAGGGTPVLRPQRDPVTLALRSDSTIYSESGGGWRDLAYGTGTGSSPINPKFEAGTNNQTLWESEVLRPVYRALFTDWQNHDNAGDLLDFPDLGDAASSDPNKTPGIVANPLPSFASTFGPEPQSKPVSVPIPASVKDILLDGAQKLVTFAAGLEGRGSPMAIDLPVIGKSLADLVQLRARLHDGLQVPLESYFASDSTPTFGELFSALGSSLTGTLDSLEPVVEFDYDLLTDFSQTAQLDLGSKADSLGIGLTTAASVTVDARLGFVDAANANIPKFRFGIDLSKVASSPADAFYFNADRLSASAKVDADNVDAGVRVGFLDARISDGNVDLNAAVSLDLNDPNSDGRITTAELVGTPLSSLVTVTPRGNFNASVPVGVEAFGLSTESGTLTLGASDIFEPTTYTADFDKKFDHLKGFRNLNAQDVVVGLGKLRDSLARFSENDQVRSRALPFVAGNVGDLVDFADSIGDALLFDDGDDGVDGSNALISDLNKAIETAGLASVIAAEGVEEAIGDVRSFKVQILARDPETRRIKIVSATGALGFVKDQEVISDGVRLAALVGAKAVSASGVLGDDATLEISFNDASPITLRLAKADTGDNQRVGNDRSKLLDASAAPMFQTAQQLEARLNHVLGSAAKGDYNQATRELTFDLDFSNSITVADKQVAFNADLAPFLDLSAEGKLKVEASGGAGLKLGFYLGDAPASTQLTANTRLADLRASVPIKTELAVMGERDVRAEYGRLAADSTFNLRVDAKEPVTITVRAQDTDDNWSIADLVADFSQAISLQLGSQITVKHAGGRLRFQADRLVSSFELSVDDAADPLVSELGFAAAESADRSLQFTSPNVIQATDGVLHRAATLTLEIGGAVPRSVTIVLPASMETAARPQSRLAEALNQAFAEAGLDAQLIAEIAEGQSQGQGRLQIRAIDPAIDSLTVHTLAGDYAQVALGLPETGVATWQASAIEATATLDPAAVGRLTGDAAFEVTIAGEAAIQVTVDQAATNRNSSIVDLVDDINRALGAAGVKEHLKDRIKADSQGQRLVFTALPEVPGFSISTTAGSAANRELGLAAYSEANRADLTILTRSGERFDVALDGAVTIGDVIDRIHAQTGIIPGTGRQRVEASIQRPSGLGLQLHDQTDGAATFQVLTANGSMAGIALAIVGSDLGSDEELPDGFIDGSAIAGIGLLDRVFVDDVHLEGIFTLGTGSGPGDGVKAQGRIGMVGVELTGIAKLTGWISTFLKDPDAAPDASDKAGRFSLAKLVSDVKALPSRFDAPVIGGTGTVALEFGITKPSYLAGHGSIEYTITDLGQPLPAPKVVLPPVIETIKEISASDFKAGLISAVQYLSQFEGFGMLGNPLPLINKSVADLFSLDEILRAGVDQALSGPARTIQEIELALEYVLGINDEALELSLDSVGDVLRVDLQLGKTFERSLGVDLELGDSVFPRLSGAASLNGTGSIDAVLSIGLGLDSGNKGKVYLYDHTADGDLAGLFGDVDIEGNDLDFIAALGPVGVFIKDGTGKIAGSFEATLRHIGEEPNQRLLITDLDPGRHFHATLSGDANATLPVYFPTESKYINDIVLSGQLELPQVSFPDLAISPISFDLGANLLQGIDGVGVFLASLQERLSSALAGLKLPVIGNKLSGLSDAIGKIGPALSDLMRKGYEQALAHPDKVDEVVREVLFDTLGPGTGGGLNLALLRDLDPTPNGIDENDIRFSSSDSGAPKDKRFMQWNMRLGHDDTLLDTGIDFDIGLPGLGLETHGDVVVDFSWDLDFGFGIDYQDGFFITLSDGDELDLSLTVDIPGMEITGQLGFLQLTATDAHHGADRTQRTHLSAGLAIDVFNRSNRADHRISLGELSMLGIEPLIKADARAELALTLEANEKLAGGTIARAMPKLTADFVFDWALEGAGPRGVKLSEVRDAVAEGLKKVEFLDVGLDIGPFVSGFLGPMVDDIQKVIKPLKKQLDFLTKPIPVLDKLGARITPLDLAASGLASLDVDPRSLVKAITAISDIANAISVVKDIQGDVIVLGDLTLFDREDPERTRVSNLSAANLADRFFDIADLFKSKVAVTGDYTEVNWRDAIGELEKNSTKPEITKSFEIIKEGRGFEFPLLKNPKRAMEMLLGRPVDLVTFTLPKIEFDASYTQFFPIVGPLGAAITGSIGATVDVGFGFDTYGLAEAKKTGSPSAIREGFYLLDRDQNGAEKVEAELRGSLRASLELYLKFIRGGVEGGVFPRVQMDLYDPNDDGKVRFFSEFLGSMEAEKRFGDGRSQKFWYLGGFDVNGDVSARLYAFYEAKLFGKKIRKEFKIVPNVKLIDFGINFDRPAVLARELDGGALELNMGLNAHRRLNGDTTDGAEQFFVKQDGDDHVKVWSPLLGVSEGDAQRYAVSTTLRVLAGDGDDLIDLAGLTQASIKFELDGGAGRDTIKMGSGGGTARGGVGDDTLLGGAGVDHLFGELGDDRVDGGGGDDWLIGDEGRISGDFLTVDPLLLDGSDILIGGDGNDVLVGGGGNDLFYGDFGPLGTPGSDASGDDLMVGDGGRVRVSSRAIDEAYVAATSSGGDDQLYGQGGADSIHAGWGSDVVDGGDGSDVLHGGAGADHLSGQGGDDKIYGGEEPDSIFGGAGNDTIYGDALAQIAGGKSLAVGFGNDVVHGDSGDDEIHGGFGADNLFGDDGDDRLFGEGDSDQLHGGAGNDFLSAGNGFNVVWGEDGQDTIQADSGDNLLWGGDGDDSITGGSGSDEIHGELGSDTLLGGDGNDLLIGNVGNDSLGGEGGDDILWGGERLADSSLLDLGDAGNFANSLRGDITPIRIARPEGTDGDGEDTVDGGAGTDFVFGGGDNDILRGGAGIDYLDGGLGNDGLAGDGGNDILKGGKDSDTLHGDHNVVPGESPKLNGDEGVDVVFGEEGDDFLYGDDGVGNKLYGGAGNDKLYAFAWEGSQDSGWTLESEILKTGDELFGDEGDDQLWGNLRRDTLYGGAGKDVLHGDGLRGPRYIDSTEPTLYGGKDTLYGNGGDDTLYGGGGDDVLWGGAGSDRLVGHDGDDRLYGGDGIDILVLDTDSLFQKTGNDDFQGYYGNESWDQTKTNDDSTDVLLLEGTAADDTIVVGQRSDDGKVGENSVYGRLVVTVNGNETVAQWRNPSVVKGTLGAPRIEQFQVNGNLGNDTIAFQMLSDGDKKTEALSFTGITTSAAEYLTRIDGGAGNDTLRGSSQRDWINGNAGSDAIHGLAGDDQLWGDYKVESLVGDNSVDRIYGGAGNDDLIGGRNNRQNWLYAWTTDPSSGPGKRFGVYKDNSYKELEDTGLDRMLGWEESEDNLYGGTGVSFLYGNAGESSLDTYYRADGTVFSTPGGTLVGDKDDLWKEYAKENTKVWYVPITDLNDTIYVKYDTTGSLANHHYVQWENKFSSATKFRFGYSDRSNETKIVEYWQTGITDAHEQSLLPDEADFSAIIVDALGGEDTVTVSKFVEKTVWIDGGKGDDKLTLDSSGQPSGARRDVLIGGDGNDTLWGGVGC